MSNVTHIAIVLDRSGSMTTMKREVVDGFNEQVSAIRESFDPEVTTLSFYSFASSVKEHFFNESIGDVKNLTMDGYKPSGWTSLNDAVAMSIDKLSSIEVDDDTNTAFMVVIISDGKENQSVIFGGKDGSSVLSRKILQKTKEGNWTFTYLGSSDLDLTDVSKRYSIPAANISSFRQGADGMIIGSHNNVTGLKKMATARKTGTKSSSNFYGSNSIASTNKDNEFSDKFA